MYKKLLLSLLSAILLAMAWNSMGGWWLLIAFVPLLILQKECKKRFGLWVLLSFTVWIVLSAWWVAVSTPIAAFAVPIVGLFFCWIPFMIYHYVWKKQGGMLAWVVLVTAWIAFEALYTYQIISFPWLNLGNGFAGDIWAVQWYEYTGTFGGTLWILVSNILAYNLWCQRGNVKRAVAFGLWIVLPVAWSLVMYFTYQEKIDPVKVSVLQPNLDPYAEKFGDTALSQVEQTEILLELAAQAQPGVRYIVTPETALDNYFYIQTLSRNSTIMDIRNFIKARQPQATMILGATTFDANKVVYNSAMWVDSSQNVEVYHKAKLVMGAETTPFPGLFEFLRIDLGGISANLGSSTNRDIYDSTGVAICYESVYGAYFTDYIDNGASFMCIITNDGWWGDTQGYRQHLNYARLRAVETRRSIARSANTGISALINQRGDIIESLGWDTQGVINGTINKNSERTVYVRCKDLVIRISLYVLALSLLYFVAIKFKRKR